MDPKYTNSSILNPDSGEVIQYGAVCIINKVTYVQLSSEWLWYDYDVRESLELEYYTVSGLKLVTKITHVLIL